VLGPSANADPGASDVRPLLPTSRLDKVVEAGPDDARVGGPLDPRARRVGLWRQLGGLCELRRSGGLRILPAPAAGGAASTGAGGAGGAHLRIPALHPPQPSQP